MEKLQHKDDSAKNESNSNVENGTEVTTSDRPLRTSGNLNLLLKEKLMKVQQQNNAKAGSEAAKES
jgi:hypothetical protein